MFTQVTETEEYYVVVRNNNTYENIEDIEGKMIDTELAKVYEEDGYEEQVSTAYTEGNSYYPSIYAKELFRSLNGENRIESGLGMSEQTGDLIEPTDDGATNGCLLGTSLRPTQTYWYGDNSFMQTAFETTDNGVNYYNLLMPDGSGTYYWVASRCVETFSSKCFFCVRLVYYGYMAAFNVFGSDEYYDNNYCGLFPVVSLSSEVIGGDSGSGFVVQ